ncbi:MAG: hypothetical protein AAGD11_18615, partial [Planctomycetota bacterium]
RRLQRAYVDLWRTIRNPPKDPPGKWKVAAALAVPFAYHEVRRIVLAEATVLDAKKVLKSELAQVYRDKRHALRRLDCPALIRLNKYEAEILAEYNILTGVRERASREPYRANRQIKRKTLPELHEYATRLVDTISLVAVDAAVELGRENGVQMQLYPKQPALPVMVDPLAKAFQMPAEIQDWYGPRKPRTYFPRPAGVPTATNMRRQIVKVTQLCRATFPWVNYHRQPVLQYLTEHCPISDAGKMYFDETAGTTLRLCDDMQLANDYGLYVLRRATLPDKGFERWTDDPADLESLFAITCIAGELPPKDEGSSGDNSMIEDGFYSRHLPDRRVATARAMVYNAKPQSSHRHRINLSTKRIVPIRQPQIGWDTLQWAPLKGKMPFEIIGKGSLLRHEMPRVEVGWHAKLVPFAPGRLEQLATNATPDYGKETPTMEIQIVDEFASLTTH